jgi:hypothetical protein
LPEPEPSQEQAHVELDPTEVQVVEEAPTGQHLLQTPPSLSISLPSRKLDLFYLGHRHPFEGHLSFPNPSFSLKGDYDDGLNEFPSEGGSGASFI